MTSILMVVIGFVAGCGAASIVWASIVSGGKKNRDAEKVAREDMMKQVAAIFADADAIESKFRNGQLMPENFRRSLSDLCSAATSFLRTNMHTLDIFFVKYAEQQIREYKYEAENPERRRMADTDFAITAPAVSRETLADGDVGAKLPISAVSTDPTAAPPPPIKLNLPKTDVSQPALPEKLDVTPHEPISDMHQDDELVLDEAKDSADDELVLDEAKDSTDEVTADDELVLDEAKGSAEDDEVVFGEQKDDAVEIGAIEQAPIDDDTGAIDIEGPVLGESEDDDGLVLGELAEGAELKPFAAVSAPPLSPPPVVSAPRQPEEDDIEDFEAKFALFEAQVESPAPTPVAPTPAAPVFAPALEEFETPTMEIPIPALRAAAQAAPPQPPIFQAPPPIIQQTPMPVKSNEPQDNSIITGDDVMDTIDNLFNLK